MYASAATSIRSDRANARDRLRWDRALLALATLLTSLLVLALPAHPARARAATARAATLSDLPEARAPMQPQARRLLAKQRRQSPMQVDAASADSGRRIASNGPTAWLLASAPSASTPASTPASINAHPAAAPPLHLNHGAAIRLMPPGQAPPRH